MLAFTVVAYRSLSLSGGFCFDEQRHCLKKFTHKNFRRSPSKFRLNNFELKILRGEFFQLWYEKFIFHMSIDLYINNTILSNEISQLGLCDNGKSDISISAIIFYRFISIKKFSPQCVQ